MKILLVEDDSYYADLVRSLLDGIDVTVVDTLNLARKRLDNERFDMVVLDLTLPDSMGVETARVIRAYRLPTVVLSARTDITQEIIDMGILDYIEKSGDVYGVYERLLFNIKKSNKRFRFQPEVFEQIKACLCPVGAENEWARAS